jgi:hypothetical protein
MSDRRPVIAVTAAAVVVVVVTALVVAFGVRRLPVLPTVADPPRLPLPGTIAYVKSAEDHGRQCVHVIPAAGGQEFVAHCTGDPQLDAINEVAWTAQGDLVISGFGAFAGSTTVVVDIRGGEPRGVRTVDRSTPERPLAGDERRVRDDGAELVVGGDDGVARLAIRSDADTTAEILALPGPRDYAFSDAQWSPDGAWILVADGDGRLLVTPEQGGDARLVATTTAAGAYNGNVAWFIPGDTTYTVAV